MNPSPVYLVFGASGGIGSALVHKLFQTGATLAIASRDSDRLSTLAEQTDALGFSLDASRSDEVEDCVRTVQDTYGKVDGVVNCVGSILLKPAHLTSSDEWHSTLSTNLDSSFNVVKAATRAMMRTGGSIVLVSSAVSMHGIHNHEAIAAAKSGVNGLVRSAAATYARRGIRVNGVAPGLVETPATAHLVQNEASRKASLAMHALQRLGTPDDIAEAIRFFLDSDKSGWITGQILAVDGGLSSVRPY